MVLYVAVPESDEGQVSEPYAVRVVDDELNQLVPGLPAIAIEGARGVGKTATASRRARTIVRLDDPAIRAIAEAAAESVLNGEAPVLLDEWQRVPPVWDAVRRAVDPTRAGVDSCSPDPRARGATDTFRGGTDRIGADATARTAERGLERRPSVLARLLTGERAAVPARPAWGWRTTCR